MNRQKCCRVVTALSGAVFVLIIILAWSQYLTLKKVLVSRIADKATHLFGQKVEIGDLYLNNTGGITVAGIVIKSPEGFGEGELLRIKEIILDMRYQEIFSGRFSFRSIEVTGPELSLVMGQEGPNVSGKLKEFLSKKGTAEYLVDRFTISGAGISINDDPLYRLRDINIRIANLSSRPDTKTTFGATLRHLGVSLALEGWAYLKDEDKKFSISLKSDDIDLVIFKDRLASYGIDPGKSRVSIELSADGDLENGIKIKTNAELKSRGLFLYERTTVKADAEALFSIRKQTLNIGRMLIRSGEDVSIEAKGAIRNIYNAPDYSAEIIVHKLDLASFNFIKGLQLGGTVTSGPVAVNGRLSSAMPNINGSMMVREGLFRSADNEIQAMNGKISFSSGDELYIMTEAEGRIFKAGKLALKKPAGIRLKADAKGTIRNAAISSNLGLSDIVSEYDRKVFSASELNLSYDGIVRDRALSGKLSVDGRNISFDAYKAERLNAWGIIEYEKGGIIFRNIKLKSDMISADAERVSAAPVPGRGDLIIEAGNINVSYPKKNADISGLAFRAAIKKNEDTFGGEFSFSAGHVSVQKISTGPISGEGSLADRGFVLQIPSAGMFGGKTKISVKGSRDIFPMTLHAASDRINLGAASDAVRSFVALPYSLSGVTEQIRFDGIVRSKEEIDGSAVLRSGRFSVIDQSKRTMLKDASVNTEITFRGRDMDIKTDLVLPAIAVKLSGNAAGFLSEDRIVRLNLLLAETKLEDIRAAFWDVVPDRLLYAGLHGSLALNLSASYGSKGLTASGTALLRDISVEGENGEYAIGPVNGMLPINYDGAGRPEDYDPVFLHDQSDIGTLKQYYTKALKFSGNEISIGSIRYGFRLLEDISVWVEQKGSALKINRLSAKMFGGRVYGSAVINSRDGLSYRAGLIADKVSLSDLCEEIPQIRGYISGKVDGTAAIRGDASGMTGITGKADFRTYGADGEKTRISREFLEKIGGPQVKAYLGERPFNKGVMGLYIQNGFIIFRELEISNRNFAGITDLSVKVAPLNNRIGIEHLMWTITEAAQRAKKE